MISDPDHERFYVDNNEDHMPAFGKQLSPEEIDLLARWLRREWYEPRLYQRNAKGQVTRPCEHAPSVSA